jgi:hypothetical protein
MYSRSHSPHRRFSPLLGFRAALVGLGLAVALPLAASANPAEPPPGASLPGQAGPKYAMAGTSAQTLLRSLDDPDNPYLGQYSDYDSVPNITGDEITAWFRADTPEGQAIKARYPEGWTMEMAMCGAEGWLLPASLSVLELTHSAGLPLKDMVHDPSGKQQSGSLNILRFYAAGVMSPKIVAQKELDRKRQSASAIPPIPAWLGEHPPLAAVFPPSGEILVLGPLDLRIERPAGQYVDSISSSQEAGSWYRYSAEGRLLGSCRASDERHDGWRLLYGLDVDALQRSRQGVAGWSSTNAGRYLVLSAKSLPGEVGVVDQSPYEFVGAYDYDGSMVDPAYTPDAASLRGCQQVSQSTIRSIYASQLELGITSPDSASPYWGTPEGPVFVDPTPRPARKFAKSAYGADAPAIAVTPPDDPSNPYRDEYTPVERWLYDKSGYGYSILSGQEPPDLADLYAWGKPDYEANMAGFTDSAGNLIPFSRRCEWLENHGLIPNPADADPKLRELPRLWAQAPMPAEVWDAYCQTMWERGVSKLPRVPDWLMALRSQWVVFLPEGDILAQPSSNQVEGNRARFNPPQNVWVQYGADGTELRRAEVASWSEWAEMFDPTYKQKVEAARQQGYGAFFHQGYLKVWPKDAANMARPLAAYSYTGAPLDPTALTPLGPGLCELRQSHDLKRIYAIQRYILTRDAAAK